eukprot:4850292-Prymnesium_polylepis.1
MYTPQLQLTQRLRLRLAPRAVRGADVRYVCTTCGRMSGSPVRGPWRAAARRQHTCGLGRSDVSTAAVPAGRYLHLSRSSHPKSAMVARWCAACPRCCAKVSTPTVRPYLIRPQAPREGTFTTCTTTASFVHALHKELGFESHICSPRRLCPRSTHAPRPRRSVVVHGSGGSARRPDRLVNRSHDGIGELSANMLKSTPRVS